MSYGWGYSTSGFKLKFTRDFPIAAAYNLWRSDKIDLYIESRSRVIEIPSSAYLSNFGKIKPEIYKSRLMVRRLLKFKK